MKPSTLFFFNTPVQNIEWSAIEQILVEDQKPIRVRVSGTSMYPILFAGDYVTLSPLAKTNHGEDKAVPAKQPELPTASNRRSFTTKPNLSSTNALFFVRAQGKYYIHTLDPQTGRTKGHNNLTGDPLPDQWIGVVTQIEKTMTSRIKRLWYSLWRKRPNHF